MKNNVEVLSDKIGKWCGIWRMRRLIYMDSWVYVSSRRYVTIVLKSIVSIVRAWHSVLAGSGEHLPCRFHPGRPVLSSSSNNTDIGIEPSVLVRRYWIRFRYWCTPHGGDPRKRTGEIFTSLKIYKHTTQQFKLALVEFLYIAHQGGRRWPTHLLNTLESNPSHRAELPYRIPAVLVQHSRGVARCFVWGDVCECE